MNARLVIFCLLACIATAGCASRRPVIVSPPTVGKVRQAAVSAREEVVTVRRAVSEGSAAVSEARAGIAGARRELQAVNAAAPASSEAAPLVAEFRARLPVILRQLEDADRRAAAAEQSLAHASGKAAAAEGRIAEADSRAVELQLQIDRQAASLAEASEGRLDAERRAAESSVIASRQRGLAWKWRLSCLSLAAAILLFVFRRPLGAMFGLSIP